MSVDVLPFYRHPDDPVYQEWWLAQRKQLAPLTERQLEKRLELGMRATPPRDDHEINQKRVGELFDYVMKIGSPQLQKDILGTTTTSGLVSGAAMIRQDLQPEIYTLFVKKFPYYERIKKLPSNGLVHTETQMTTPDEGTALTNIAVSEIGTVNYLSSQYNRATYPIAIMANGRGVSFLESAAVRAGGAPYDPAKNELSSATITLAKGIQTLIFQGNATNTSGQANQEAGLYYANFFDGFRGVIGSVGSFAGNGAVQLDQGAKNVTAQIRAAATATYNNGGSPSLAVMSSTAKQAVDDENAGNQRYNDDQVDIIPGVRANRLTWSEGTLDVLGVPGSTIGTYNRTSDGANVEDVYVLDEDALILRWLFAPDFTVLQIPSGVDSVLSERWIVFTMQGLQIAAPLFEAKVRRLAA